MASFAIIRMQKFKIADVQGIQKHNQRQGKSKSNPDIDYERSNQNYDLLNDQNLKYESEIKERISERVKRKPRANSVVLSEFMVTASPEYMKSLSADEQKKYFERALDFVRDRYGKENTLYAVVHHDESTPHMHVGVIPITKDDRLSAKDIFTRSELQQLQNDFPEHMKANGFEVERGQPSDKKHLSPQEYKEKQDLEKEKTLLEKNIVEKKNELLSFGERIPDKEIRLKPKRIEIQTEVKPKIIGKPEIIQEETGNYVFTPKQVEKIENLLTAAVVIKKDYERLLSTDLVRENQDLHEALDGHHEALQFAQKRNVALEREIKDLKKENWDLKAHISDLRDEIHLLYKNTKEFLKERTENVRAFKNVFKDFIGELRERVAGSEFERLYKREKVRERNKGLER